MTGVRSQELAANPTGDLRCRWNFNTTLFTQLASWIKKYLMLCSRIGIGMFSYERKEICSMEKHKSARKMEADL